MPNARTNLGTPPAEGGRISVKGTLPADLLSSPLPCALLDRNGCITEASAGLLANAPDSVGRRMSDAFGVSATNRERSRKRPETAKYGVYRKPSGELIPLVVQFVPISSAPDMLLAVFSDGRPFRDAEMARFEASPEATLRINLKGKIVFANSAAARSFGATTADALRGLSLKALVAEVEEAIVMEGFNTALLSEPVPPLAVTFVNKNSGGKEPFWLILMPDLAPNGRALGAVAIFRSKKVERTRNVIKQIALQGGNWRYRLRKVLQEVQSFVTFDRATFGIYAENVTLFRPVHIEPSDGLLWPALWMVLPDGVLAWLNSGKTWEDDLDHFINFIQV
jgi:PAS domain S-box-containing protein